MRLRLVVALLALLALPLVVSANEKRQGYCQLQTTGARVLGCTVTVYQTGTLTPAVIYSDNLNTPKSSTFTADATTGLWFFYASNGRYDIQFSGGSPSIGTPYTLSDFLFEDVFAITSGLAVTSISSQTPNAAQSGFLQLAPGDCISWRNNANTLDNCLTENATNQLSFAGQTFPLLGASNVWSAINTFSGTTNLTGGGSISGTWTGAPTVNGNWTFNGTQIFNVVNAVTVASLSANPAQSGILRLASGDSVAWRNQGNTADLSLTISSVNELVFSGGTQGLIAGYFGSSNTRAQSGLYRLASIEAIAWRNNANGGDVALFKTTADNLSWPNGLSLGGGAALATTAQSGTGSLCMTTSCAMVTPSLNGVIITGTPSFNQVLVASSPTAASWGTTPSPVISSTTTTLSGDISYSSGNTTTVLTQAVVMPVAGAPFRAFVCYGVYYTTGASATAANFWVDDGTSQFASMESGSGISPVPTNGTGTCGVSTTAGYSNGANITFTLKVKGNQNLTIRRLPTNSGGQSTWMTVAVLPSVN